MILDILQYPNPHLRSTAKPVLEVRQATIQTLIDNMAETMYAFGGCGLAATQVGENYRIFVIDVTNGKQLFTYINPIIKPLGTLIENNEGCLSFPTIEPTAVKRHEKVLVEALDRDGKMFQQEVTGILAVAIQHEFDHLEGRLFVDKLSASKRKALGSKLRT